MVQVVLVWHYIFCFNCSMIKCKISYIKSNNLTRVSNLCLLTIAYLTGCMETHMVLIRSVSSEEYIYVPKSSDN